MADSGDQMDFCTLGMFIIGRSLQIRLVELAAPFGHRDKKCLSVAIRTV